MLAPKVEARLAQELLLTPTDAVLEIGTGSGYQAASLATLAQQVTTVEIDSRLVAFAQQNLQMNNVPNVKVETGDGRNGWGTTEYDAILLDRLGARGAGRPEVPAAHRRADGGGGRHGAGHDGLPHHAHDGRQLRNGSTCSKPSSSAARRHGIAVQVLGRDRHADQPPCDLAYQGRRGTLEFKGHRNRAGRPSCGPGRSPAVFPYRSRRP